MNKEDVDKMIKEIHDFTVEYAKKYPEKFDLTVMNEADEQLRQKLYAIVSKKETTKHE